MSKQSEAAYEQDRLISTITQKQASISPLSNHPCKGPASNNVAVQQSVVSSKSLEKKDIETETISSIQNSEQKVKKQLADMIEEYKKQAQKMMANHGWDPEKQANIRNHLRKLKKEKEQRRARFQEDLRKLEQKRNTLETSNISNEHEKIQKRQSIEKRIAKIHERERKREDQYKNFFKFYQEFKAKKPKYALLEEEFKEKEKKENEQKLKQHKQKLNEVYKPMDLTSLEEFQQNYMNRKYYAEKQRLENHLMEKKQQESNQRKLEALYKGHCHSLVLDELAEQNHKSNEAYEKSKRIKEYSQLVREEYKPRAKSSIEEEIQEESINGSQIPQTERGKRVVKERYLKGQYLGKMVTYQKESLSHEEQISKGLQYLQYLKSLPKRPKKEQKLEPMPPLPPRSGVYKVSKVQNPLYRGSRRYNSIDFSVQEGDSKSVKRILDFMHFKQQQLRQDEKLLRNGTFKNRSEWQAQQKKFNSELVSNIEEKLHILKRL